MARFDDPPEDDLPDDQLWERKYREWRRKLGSASEDDDAAYDAADRATNYVEHRRAEKRRFTPLLDKVRRDQQLEEGGGTYRLGPVEKRERAEAAKVTPARLLAMAEQRPDVTEVAASPRAQVRRAEGAAKTARRKEQYDPKQLRHGAVRAAQLRRETADPEMQAQLEADEENLTRAASSLEEIDTFGGRVAQTFHNVPAFLTGTTQEEGSITRRGAEADLAAMLDTESMARRGVTGTDVSKPLTTTRPFSVAKDLAAPFLGAAPYQVVGEAAAAAALRQGARVTTSMGRTGTARQLSETARKLGPIDSPTMGERFYRGATQGQTPFAIAEGGRAEAMGEDPGTAMAASAALGVPFGIGAELGLAGVVAARNAGRRARSRWQTVADAFERENDPTPEDIATVDQRVTTETQAAERARGTPEQRADLLTKLGQALESRRETAPRLVEPPFVAKNSREVRARGEPLPSALDVASRRAEAAPPAPPRIANNPAEARRDWHEEGSERGTRASRDLLDVMTSRDPAKAPPPVTRSVPRGRVTSAEVQWDAADVAGREAMAAKADLGRYSPQAAAQVPWRQLPEPVQDALRQAALPAAVGAAALAEDEEEGAGAALAGGAALSRRPGKLARRVTALVDRMIGYGVEPQVRLTAVEWTQEMARVDGDGRAAPLFTSHENRDRILKALNNATDPTPDGLLSAEDVRRAVANVEDPDTGGRGFFHSRLRNAVAALPKAWDQPRPIADWIGKLTGSEASKFSKQEFALLRTKLDERKAADPKAKLTREDIDVLLDEVLPEVERTTLAAASDPFDYVRPDPAAAVRPLNEVMEAIQRGEVTRGEVGLQVGNRQAEVEELQNRVEAIEDALNTTTERADLEAAIEREAETEAELERRYGDLPYEAIRTRGTRPPLIQRIQTAVAEEGDVSRAIDEVVGEIRDYSDGPEINGVDLIQENGYEVKDAPGEWVVYRPERPGVFETEPRREIQRFPEFEELETGQLDTEGNPKFDEVEHDADSVLDEYRRRTGDTDDVEVEFEPSNDRIILDSNGDEVWRGDSDDLFSAAQDIVSENSLDEGIWDEWYEEMRRPLREYADALQEAEAASREAENLRENPPEEIDDGLPAEDRQALEAERVAARQRVNALYLEINRLRDHLLDAPEQRLLGAGVDPALAPLAPEVKGRPHYPSTQAIGGGRDYSEILSIWSNNPGTKYDRNHYGGTFPNLLVHVRREMHDVVDIPGITDVEVIPHVEGETDAVRHLKDEVNTKRRERDAELDEMGRLVREFEALPHTERDIQAGNLSPEAQRIYSEYQRRSQHATDLAKRAAQKEVELAQALGVDTSRQKTLNIMIENQSDWAQDAGAVGVEGRSADDGGGQLALLQRELGDIETKRRRLAGEGTRNDNEWQALRSTAFEPFRQAGWVDDWNSPTDKWYQWDAPDGTPRPVLPEWPESLHTVAHYGENDVDYQAFVANFPDPDHPARQVLRREMERFKAEQELERQSENLRERIAQVQVAGPPVPPNPFITGGAKDPADPKARSDANGDAATALGVGAFLLDAAERGTQWIGWSTAANRIRYAHFGPVGAKHIYDEFTPAAVRRIFAGLGFKDVKIARTFIRGVSHWEMELTPEMRKALRTVGVPLLGVLALSVPTSAAEAQSPDDEGSPRRASDTAVAGAVGLAGATMLGVAYRSGLRAAFKDIASRGVATNPVVLAALGVAMQQVPDDDYENFGKGVIGLAALKAIGSARMKKAGGAVGRVIVDAAQSWGAEGVVRAFTPEALLSQEVRDALQRFRETSAKGEARAREFGAKLSGQGPKVNRAVTDVMRGEAWEGPLTPDETQAALTLAMSLVPQMEEMGLAKVGEGIISPEQYVASGGEAYLPRIYAEFEAERANPALPRTPGRGEGRPVRISEQKSRTLDDLPPEERDAIREKLGEVRESSYLASAALSRGWRDVGVSMLLKELRAVPDVLHPDWATAYDDLTVARAMRQQAKTPADRLAAQQLFDDATARLRDVTRRFKTKGDYVALGDSEGLGDLAGAVVQRDVALALQGMPDVPGVTELYRWWKQSKTVFNPGTHIANVAGNMTMLHMAGLPLTQQPKWLGSAMDDMQQYGPVTKLLAERGVLNTLPLDTSMPNRPRSGPTFGDLLALREETNPLTADVLYDRGIRSVGERLADKGHAGLGDLIDRMGATASKADETIGVRKFARDAQGLYQNEDNVFRVAGYLWRKSLGDSDEAALKFARDDLVNFHTRSPLLHIARNTVAPFILFPAKALPTFGRHLVDHPERWIIAAMTLLALNEFGEQESGYDFEPGDIPERDRTMGFGPLFPELIQLPMERDERGGVAAIDFMRWTPGSAMTQGVPEHSIAGRLGLPAILQPSGPVVDLASALSTGRDPFTDKRITTERGAAALPDYLKYGVSEMLPTAASLHAPRLIDDLQKENYGKASTDALGFLGARPRYHRPGEGRRRAMYEYEDYTREENRALRTDLGQSESPEFSRERRALSRQRKARALKRRREQETSPP